MAAYALVAGGGEIFPITLANMLKARGYAVTFFNCNQEVTEPGVRGLLRSDVPLLQLNTLSSVEVVFNDLGIELVHSHHAWVDVLLSTLLAHSPAIGQVVTMHGMYEMMSPDHLKTLLPILEKRIDSFVYIAKKNLDGFPVTFRDSKDFVRIDNTVTESQISPVPRHQLGVGPDDFVLGTMERQKPKQRRIARRKNSPTTCARPRGSRRCNDAGAKPLSCLASRHGILRLKMSLISSGRPRSRISRRRGTPLNAVKVHVCAPIRLPSPWVQVVQVASTQVGSTTAA
jgi:hypothetical protein